MKKLLLFFSLFLFASGLRAGTQFSKGGFIFETLSENTVKVVGFSSDNQDMTSVEITTGVNNGANSYSVVAIGAKAFLDKTAITNVKIPYITSIGEFAFSGCTALKEVVADAVTDVYRCAFQDCKNLESCYFPKLTNIKDNTFYNDAKLKYVIAPNVTYIGEYAFAHCVAFDNVQSNRNKPSTQHKFDKLTNVQRYAFYNCKNFTNECFANETLPQSLVIISDGAFKWSGITKYTLNPNLQILGSSAFTGLKSFTVSDADFLSSATKMENILDKVKLATDGVLTIGSNSGASCDLNMKFNPSNGEMRIGQLVIGDNIANIGDGCIFNIVADSVTVGASADFTCSPSKLKVRCMEKLIIKSPKFCAENTTKKFSKSYNLLSIFGNEFSEMDASGISAEQHPACGQYAFYAIQKSALRKMTASWESVGKYAFYNNERLSDVSFQTMKTIGEWAFAFCNLSLFKTNLAVNIDAYAFSGNPIATVEIYNADSKVSENAFGDAKPMIVIDLSDKMTLASNKDNVKMVTKTESRATWLRANGYKYACSLDRMKFSIEDVNMNGGLGGDDVQLIYNAMK